MSLQIQAPLKPWELVVELGLFVGYTAIRMADVTKSSFSLPARVLSLEVDPVHALVARHFLDLSRSLAQGWTCAIHCTNIRDVAPSEPCQAKVRGECPPGFGGSPAKSVLSQQSTHSCR